VSQYVIPLVRSITTKRYERVEEASVTSRDEGVARVARISIQRVKPGRATEYLDYRRTVIHPNMAAAEGFVAAWVLRDATDPARFAIYLRWASAEAAEAHFHQPLHLGETTGRVTRGPTAAPARIGGGRQHVPGHVRAALALNGEYSTPRTARLRLLARRTAPPCSRPGARG
jgi:heme-degrading monooxygenase HmoA